MMGGACGDGGIMGEDYGGGLGGRGGGRGEGRNDVPVAEEWRMDYHGGSRSGRGYPRGGGGGIMWEDYVFSLGRTRRTWRRTKWCADGGGMDCISSAIVATRVSVAEDE